MPSEMNSAGGGTNTHAMDAPSSASATATDAPATPLFIDTGAFFPYYNDRDAHHDTARSVFQAMRTGELVHAFEHAEIDRRVAQVSADVIRAVADGVTRFLEPNP